MGSLSASFMYYFIFLLLASISGLVYWIRSEYRIGALLSFIFSLLAPLLTLFIVAQKENDAGTVHYLFEEVQEGNTFARVLLVVYIYLTGWLLFLLVRFIVKMTKTQMVQEKFQELKVKMIERKNRQDEEKQSGTDQ